MCRQPISLPANLAASNDRQADPLSNSSVRRGLLDIGAVAEINLRWIGGLFFDGAALLLERRHEHGLPFVPSCDPKLRHVLGERLGRFTRGARHAGGLALFEMIDLGSFE